MTTSATTTEQTNEQIATTRRLREAVAREREIHAHAVGEDGTWDDLIAAADATTEVNRAARAAVRADHDATATA